MPEMNGLEAARQIIKRVPTAKILILSAHSDDHYVQEAIEAGTAGYLMKESVGKDLLLAIREVARGNAFFSPPVAKRLLKQCQETFMNGGGIKPKGNKLTSRQTEVLQLIAEGHSNKEMADKLSLSIKTVEKHRQTLMDKLDLHDVALLTRYAISMGITESNVKITMV
jgi:DNA-binding NarL/FixJ family response regulator